MLAVALSTSVSFYNAIDEEPVNVFRPQHEITVIESSLGGLVAVGTDDGTVIVLEPVSCQILHEFKNSENRITFTKFSRDSSRLFCASEDEIVYVYDLILGVFHDFIPSDSEILDMCLLKNDTRIGVINYFSNERVFSVRDVSTKTVLRTIPEYPCGVRRARSCPIDDRVLTLTHGDSSDARIWDPDMESGSWITQHGFVARAEFSNDGEFILCVLWNNNIAVYDSTSLEIVRAVIVNEGLPWYLGQASMGLFYSFVSTVVQESDVLRKREFDENIVGVCGVCGVSVLL
jgi:WD40 repeat protein